jgi:hypothetical protein
MPINIFHVEIKIIQNENEIAAYSRKPPQLLLHSPQQRRVKSC